MPVVNMHEAKTQLSKLVEAALRGEEVIIARAGKPVVRIAPIPRGQPMLTEDLGALGRGKTKEEIEEILAYLQEPWSEEDLDEMLKGIHEDDDRPISAGQG